MPTSQSNRLRRPEFPGDVAKKDNPHAPRPPRIRPPIPLPPNTPGSHSSSPIYSEEQAAVAVNAQKSMEDASDKALEYVEVARLDDFLAYLHRDGSVNLAAQSAGLEPSVIYKVAEVNEGFAAYLRKVRARGIMTALDTNLQDIVNKTHESGDLDDYRKLHKVLLDMLTLNEKAGKPSSLSKRDAQSFDMILSSASD